MTITLHKKAHKFQADSYKVQATVGKSKTTKDGEILELLRVFPYAGGTKNAINLSVVEVSGGVISYIDLVCWDADEFKKLSKLKLSEGDYVEIQSCKATKRENGSWGLVFPDAEAVKKVKAI